MKVSRELCEMILKVVRAENYQPVKPAGLAKKLKLRSSDELREIKRAVKVLVKDGRLAHGPKHVVLPGKQDSSGSSSKGGSRGSSRGGDKKGNSQTKPKRKEVAGIFRRTSHGYGFFTPDNSVATDRSDDIYVPQSQTSDAADGDHVLLAVATNKARGERRTTGTIIEVLKRRTNRFVGSYIERDGYGLVTVDKGTFDSDILVGDASARNCRVGDKVVIEMAKWPSRKREGEGVIVQVLGDRGSPGVDTQMVIHEFGLPGEFPEKVLEDARKQADSFDGAVSGGRVDFTETTVITIDPKTARDFDDAISLERLDNGHWELAVHIADVSHFVPYRSEIDNEAFRRATSVYLPDRVIPMLPELVSNNLASLQPNRVRYTMTAVLEFTADGAPVATELHRGAINSAHRFNYEEIDDYLENDKPWKKKLPPEIFHLVRDMHTLAMILRERRKARGSIDLNLPDVRIDLDEDGRVAGAHAEEHTESHQIIEEFMLAANEAVAQRLADEGLFLMRRIHESPSEAKLKDLTKFVRQLGIDCSNLQDRFEIKRVIAQSTGMAQEQAIHFSILRSMQKAIYSPKEVGHYALASDAYCHFTSPIRRYPDLIIHRVVGQLIDGEKPFSDFDRLAGLGKHCSDLERRAEQAERELIKLKLMNFLSDKVGMEMQAVITGVESYGLFARGIELPAEGLIPVANLPDDRYHYDKTAKELAGHREGNQFRLGDLIQIVVERVDPDARELEFKLVEQKRKGGKSRRSSSKRGNEKEFVRKSTRGKKKKKKPEWTAPLSKKTPKKKPGSSRSSRKKAAAKKARKAAAGNAAKKKKSTKKKNTGSKNRATKKKTAAGNKSSSNRPAKKKSKSNSKSSSKSANRKSRSTGKRSTSGSPSKKKSGAKKQAGGKKGKRR